ncbi:P-loop containing nucleoside triphosphate hydrolase protein [Mycena floridula]|nr:P-loop containing nucleoside triphosphate hydrolase protein [Mycena floridula]
MSAPSLTDRKIRKKTLKVLYGLNFNKNKDHYMNDPKPDDIVIPIMGPTGAGKSSFINKLMGNDAMTVGHDLQSCTAQLDYAILHSSEHPQLGVEGQHRIIILDTPGFDDTFETDYEILRRISVWLTHSYSDGMKLAGVVYLHDISQTRMLGSTRKNFEMFRKLCGLKASPHIVLTTTKWNRVGEDEGKRRETQLVEKFWNGIIEQKAKTCRFTLTQDSALHVIKQVIHSAELAVEGAKHSLLIQQELVAIEKRLAETDSGRNLRTSLKQALESAKTMERQLKEGAAENAPPQLKKEYKENQEQTKALLQQIEDLKIPISRQIMALFGFHQHVQHVFIPFSRLVEGVNI